VINVFLDGLRKLSPEEVVKTVERAGYRVDKATVASDAERPHVIVKVDKTIDPKDGEKLAKDLGQTSMPVKTGRKKTDGVVYGPEKVDFVDSGWQSEGVYKRRHRPKKDNLEPLEWAGERYPETTAPVRTYEYDADKGKGKWYDSKVLSEEEWKVSKRRDAAAKDIKEGNYDPYFNVEERFHIPEGLYAFEDTAKVVPKDPKTFDKWEKIANNPEALQKLREAYLSNAGEPMSRDWYAMGQLYDEFVKVYGPDKAPGMFKQNFADAMAATTGGADPQSNFLMAMYGNFLRTPKQPIPGSPNQFSHPIGGRYASGNMEKYDEMINQGLGVTLNTPKRLDFSQAYRGDPNAMTMDEQMSSVWGFNAPPWYGNFTGAGRAVAESMGIKPRDFQDVAWAGIKSAKDQSKGKEPFLGKPMMSFVDEALERTARVTGKDKESILRDHIIQGKGPVYGAAAAAMTGGMLATDEEAEAATGLGKLASTFVKRAKSAAGEARRGGTDSATALNRIVEQMTRLENLSGRQITENDRRRGLDELFKVYQDEQMRAWGKDYTGVSPKRPVPMENRGMLSGETGDMSGYELRVDRPYTADEERQVAKYLAEEQVMREKPSLYQGNFGDEGPYFADPYEPKFYSQEGKHGDVKEIPVKDGKALYGGGAAAGALSISDAEADPGTALAGSGVLDTNGRISEGGFLEGVDSFRRGFMDFGEQVFADMGGSALALGSLVSDNLRGQPADYEKAKRWYNKIAHGTELLTDDPSLDNFRAADLLDDWAAQHPYVGGTVQGLMDSLGNAVDYLDVNQEKAPEWAHPFIYGTGAIF
jgi:hypothetical protein